MWGEVERGDLCVQRETVWVGRGEEGGGGVDVPDADGARAVCDGVAGREDFGLPSAPRESLSF